MHRLRKYKQSWINKNPEQAKNIWNRNLWICVLWDITVLGQVNEPGVHANFLVESKGDWWQCLNATYLHLHGSYQLLSLLFSVCPFNVLLTTPPPHPLFLFMNYLHISKHTDRWDTRQIPSELPNTQSYLVVRHSGSLRRPLISFPKLLFIILLLNVSQIPWSSR